MGQSYPPEEKHGQSTDVEWEVASRIIPFISPRMTISTKFNLLFLAFKDITIMESSTTNIVGGSYSRSIHIWALVVYLITDKPNTNEHTWSLPQYQSLLTATSDRPCNILFSAPWSRITHRIILQQTAMHCIVFKDGKDVPWMDGKKTFMELPLTRSLMEMVP